MHYGRILFKLAKLINLVRWIWFQEKMLVDTNIHIPVFVSEDQRLYSHE